jgi:hypothetical protein
MICYLSRNYRGIDSAGNKAKTDIEQIMKSHGFRNVGLRQTRYKNVIAAFCCTLFSILKGIFCLHKGDVLILQYPLKKYYVFVCNMAHLRGCKVITLIHDLGSFRRKRLTIPQEIARLNHSDCVIVHSERMKDWLIEHGIKAKLQILEIFDYLSDAQPVIHKNRLSKSPVRILFVGALSSYHNDFLYKQINSDRSYEMVLYGGGLETEKLLGKVDYKGFVPSDELIATAECEYGLAWYGSSLEEGSGALGEYLQYNAPHKMSLYIRCGLPLIVWEKAGLASFVRRNNVGICISSLTCLEKKLSEITPEQYLEMKKNVLQLADQLSHGYYCFKAIKQACADLGVKIKK